MSHHRTKLHRRPSIPAAAAIALVALTLVVAAPAAAAAPAGRSDAPARSEPGISLGSLIAHWLGLGVEAGSRSAGPDRRSSPGTGPAEGDDGPHMDPDGLADDDEDGPHMDPDG